MAVFATGFTKFLAASNTGRNAAHSARTIERRVNREYHIVLIIEGKCARRATRRFRMAQLELSSLQFGAGRWNAAEPAFLALSDSASRQISKRIWRTNG